MSNDTTITKEPIEEGMTDEEIAKLIDVSLKAGAIRAWREGNMLLSEWKIIKQP
jgi:hypothetical protein